MKSSNIACCVYKNVNTNLNAPISFYFEKFPRILGERIYYKCNLITSSPNNIEKALLSIILNTLCCLWGTHKNGSDYML